MPPAKFERQIINDASPPGSLGGMPPLGVGHQRLDPPI